MDLDIYQVVGRYFKSMSKSKGICSGNYRSTTRVLVFQGKSGGESRYSWGAQGTAMTTYWT